MEALKKPAYTMIRNQLEALKKPAYMLIKEIKWRDSKASLHDDKRN